MEEYTKNKEKKDIISRSIMMLTQFEGNKENSYHDPETNLGNITIGIGVLIVKDNIVTKNGKYLMEMLKLTDSSEFIKKVKPSTGFKLDLSSRNDLFNYAFKSVLKELVDKYKNWVNLPFKAQLAMINISYQWGIKGAPKTFEYINNQNYRDATQSFFRNNQIYNQIALEKLNSNADDSISTSRQEWNGKLIASCDPVYLAELQSSQK